MDLRNIREELKRRSIFDLPLRVTYYARVSTDFDEQLNSLDNQISYFQDLITKNPNWTFVEGYVDEGLSGASVAKRDAFLRMIDDAANDKFDLVITKEISRFARNTLDSIQYTRKLLQCGVGVYFESDNINTFDDDSELRLTIMASLAQDELRRLSRRIKFGHKQAIKKGRVIGCTRLRGYHYKDCRLTINEDEAPMIELLFDLYATGDYSSDQIAERLWEKGFHNLNGAKFAGSVLCQMIANPRYKGYYVGNKTHKYDYRLNDVKYLDESEWVMYKDEENVPPIVSEELWDKANAILKKRSANKLEDKSSYQNKYAYSGKVICAEHDVAYYRTLYRYKSGDKEAWHCKRYSERGKVGCDLPVIYTTELDEVMRDAYNAIIKDKSAIIHDLVRIYSSISSGSKIKEDIAKTKTQINEILKRKDKLLDHNIEGRISDDEFTKRNNAFNLEIEGLEVRLANLHEEEQKNKDIAGTVETLRQMIADELDFTDGFDNAIIDSLLEKIEVHKTDNKKVVKLKVYFKVLEDKVDYRITRGKTTSVCSKAYEDWGQKPLFSRHSGCRGGQFAEAPRPFPL